VKKSRRRNERKMPARTGAAAGIRRATRRVRCFGKKCGLQADRAGQKKKCGLHQQCPKARTVEGAPDKLKCTVLASDKQDKNISKGRKCNSQAYDPIQQGHHSHERAQSKRWTLATGSNAAPQLVRTCTVWQPPEPWK
jgi:hypothetical protein